MSAGVRPENPKISAEAQKANAEVGYGENNPEPMMFHLEHAAKNTTKSGQTPNALHAAEEYINHKQS